MGDMAGENVRARFLPPRLVRDELAVYAGVGSTHVEHNAGFEAGLRNLVEPAVPVA